ncbi:outer membrane transport energization protein TonB [Chitinophaga eiseniae]|uniref:Outer membrane transport energization protein TonB n=1 Tax=Chitinophaga eiseniae TaxID=634771 RepID=A0A1T4KD76_9BACT|nr:energy transducer TonB [Chitinophaga eiseniae]SJZ40327.1 outer membrane transport energization protein TonB [Chitinophaga eiseniae]
MESAKIPGNDFLDILFEGRNKDYGAYALRNRYDRRVRNAVMGTASIVLVVMGGYVLNNTLMAHDVVSRPVVLETPRMIDPLDEPLPDPVLPPPPPVQTSPPPAAPTVDFASLVVAPDREVRPEEEPPRINDIGNKAIGFENKEGDPNGRPEGLDDLTGPTTGVVDIPVAPEREERFTFVEFMPEFPGGEPALMKYLSKNIRYPHMAQENGVQGSVFIQFVVNRDGSISEVKAVGASKGAGLEEEAIRVVSKMPNWKPGKQNGKAVTVIFNLPIRFQLDNQ